MEVKDIRMSTAYPRDVDHLGDNQLQQSDVLIIGAGLAGLSCALSLKKAGLNFQLLEAKSTPGGRVNTVRKPFDNAEEGDAVLYDGITEVIQQYINPQLPLVKDIANATQLSKQQKQLDELTWNFLLLKSGMSKKEVDLFNAVISVKDDGDQISALFFLPEMLNGVTKFKMKGRTNQLPVKERKGPYTRENKQPEVS